MKRLLCLLLALPCSANAADGSELRVAVVIGSDEGDPDEATLEYAEADAVRFHQFLGELGGVAPERNYLLTRGGAEAARRAFLEVRGRLAELRQGARTVLIVYVSSHADEESLHLSGSRLPIAEIRALLAEGAADLSLGVIDACRTKVPGKRKGGSPGPEIRVAAERPSQVAGAVLVTAAGEGEAAQEWGSLRGSLFTHHLLTGLRGLADANGDGLVSLSETYSHAFSKTASQSVLGKAGLQRPSFDMNIAGWGDWVFTRPAQLGAAVVLEAELEGTFWIADSAQQLVGEVGKRKGETVRVALKPGWYRVVKPGGEFVDAADVNLGWGGERALLARDLVRLPRRRVMLRGSEPITLRPMRVGISGSLGVGPVGGLQPGANLAVAYERAPLFAQVTLTGGRGTQKLEGLTLTETEWGARLGVGFTTRVWFAVLAIGVDARAAFVVQQVRRDDAVELERVFGVTEPDRRAVLFGGGASLALWIPLTERWWIDLALTSGLLRTPHWNGEVVAHLRHQASMGVSWAF